MNRHIDNASWLERTIGMVGVSIVLFASAACGACERDTDAPHAPDSLASADASIRGEDARASGAADAGGRGGTTADAAATQRACAATGKAGYTSQSLHSGGDPRRYELFVPPSYDGTRRYPVVIAFHGDGGTGAGMRGVGLEDATSGNAIIVYPDGKNFAWDLETPPDVNADYVFFDDLVADVARKTCIDEARIFVFGMSRGGFFVNQLGCYRGNVVRGLVSHSGGGPYSNSGSDFGSDGIFRACTSPPPAAMIIHGKEDGVVTIEGGGVKSARHWRVKNSCGTATTPFPPSPCAAYEGCTAGHAVVWCAVDGLGHSIWSSAANASWTFFRGL